MHSTEHHSQFPPQSFASNLVIISLVSISSFITPLLDINYRDLGPCVPAIFLVGNGPCILYTCDLQLYFLFYLFVYRPQGQRYRDIGHFARDNGDNGPCLAEIAISSDSSDYVDTEVI